MQRLTLAIMLACVLTDCASLTRREVDQENGTIAPPPAEATHSPNQLRAGHSVDNPPAETAYQTESLLTIAQIAIGLAGFTGIVSAVLTGSAKNSEKSKLRIRQLLDTSLGTAFYAFLPMIIVPVAGSEPVAWRWSNAILAVAHSLTLVVSVQRANALGGAVVGRPGPYLQLMRVGGLATIALNCAAAVNLVAWHTTTFLLGLLYLLFVASHTFVRLLLDK
jgi:hypothetical protein